MKLPALVLCNLLFCLAAFPADQFETAASAFERGDFVSAESTLRSLLKTDPANPSALGLLGAVLDSEKKYPEADLVYRHAIRLNPRSATILDNYANHQLTTGDKAGARSSYLKVIALDPTRANANLQLAELAIEDRQGAAAWRFLQHLPSSSAAEPQVQILQLQALYLAKRSAEANALAVRLAASPDPRLSFSTGLALAAVNQYSEAESFFARTLNSAPQDFDVLYNLGLAAFHAGHLAPARDALTSALAQRSKDADVLFNLAAVYIGLRQQETALRLLSEASRIDPSRANVQLALAQTASALGYYADSRLAYERYLKMNPKDTGAEREHLFTVALTEQPRDGLLALKAFARAHATDAAAHYEVGVLEAKNDPTEAAASFEKALALQPGYIPARLGRGTLNYLQGKPIAALPDLQAAVREYPENAAVLDRLGEVYSALNQPSQAVASLTKASAIAPRDSRILMHLSRAQAKAGESEAARSTLVRFRALGPQPGNLIPQPGVVEFLGLPVEQQQARYNEEVTRRVAEHPDDADLDKRYLEVLINQGKVTELSPVIDRLIAAKPAFVLAAEAGAELVAAKQYATAKPVLDYAAAQEPASQKIQLHLAVIDLHTSGARVALARLEKIPPSAQSGDFLLAKAILLQAAGKTSDAGLAFTEAEKARPTSLILYAEAVSLLVRDGNQEQAVRLVKLAERLMPNSPQTESLQASLGS